MRRTRGLQPEDADLWYRVVQSVTPMHARPPRPLTAMDPTPTAEKPHRRATRIEPFHIGERASRDHVAIRPQPEPAVQMDHKAFIRMARGKLAPQARIDLHGMTLAEAHPELIHFVLGAHAAGHRLVLVITGKGRRGTEGGAIPQRTGILRHQVPHWLTMPPLAPLILQVAEAHLKHGGGGALYVYLRRTR